MTTATVDPKTLKYWLDKGEAVLIDVREPAEYDSEHIEGSTLIPLSRIGSKVMPDHQNKRLVIHCRKGGRGNSACEKIQKELSGTEIYNLEGGIEAWTAAGLHVRTSGKRIMPIDRQTQLTIGLFVVAGSLLGYYYNRSFFLLSGFFGAGLTFAGLTGFCGLARLLARMPWNQ